MENMQSKFEKYCEVLNACAYMSFYELRNLLKKEKEYTFEDLLLMVLRENPTNLIRLYDDYKYNKRGI